jgi:iron complex transport system substrate-binding protein
VNYQALADITAGISDRPTAFLNVPRGESWSMPGGRSYQAQFLADASAAYLWEDDDRSGNLTLDFEAVFETASLADYWINPSQRPILAEGQAADERFTEFAAFQSGNIYDNNANLNEFGGNLYWELGVTHPDRILADLIKIFHPELLPEHELVFFQQLVPNNGTAEE